MDINWPTVCISHKYCDSVLAANKRNKLTTGYLNSTAINEC